VSFASAADFRKEVNCECGGVAVQIWLRAPGLAGVEEPSTRGVHRSFQPGYDVQAGRHFNSRSEREQWAKSKGLEGLGETEYRRTVAAAPAEPEPDFSTLKDTIADAYEEVAAGKQGPPLARIDSDTKPIIVGGD